MERVFQNYAIKYSNSFPKMNFKYQILVWKLPVKLKTPLNPFKTGCCRIPIFPPQPASPKPCAWFQTTKRWKIGKDQLMASRVRSMRNLKILCNRREMYLKVKTSAGLCLK